MKTKKTTTPTKKKKKTAATRHQAYSRTTMWRVHQIDAMLREGKTPNIPYLMEKLQASRRSIVRDIQYIRDSLNYPIKFCRKRRGFYYDGPVGHLPTYQISEHELLTLCIARQAFEPYRGTRFEAVLRGAFDKLVQSVGCGFDIPWDEVESVISFRTSGLEIVTDFVLVESLRTAIIARQEIEFSYTKLHETQPEIRRGQPIHVLCFDNTWYLFLFDNARNEEIRAFALSRIHSMNPTGRICKAGRKFNVEAHLVHSIGVYSGDNPEHVRIWLDKVPARIIAERRWHRSQKITRTAGGDSELSMDVAITPEFLRWVLSWGPEVRILEPQSLRQKVYDYARQIVEWGCE